MGNSILNDRKHYQKSMEKGDPTLLILTVISIKTPLLVPNKKKSQDSVHTTVCYDYSLLVHKYIKQTVRLTSLQLYMPVKVPFRSKLSFAYYYMSGGDL